MGASAKPTAGTGRGAEVPITPASLDRIASPALRREAELALSRGESAALLAGRGDDGRAVETLVLSTGRAAQTAGGHVHRGIWSGGRLHTDAGCHALDADGACFCRDCETAGGYCVDDDE